MKNYITDVLHRLSRHWQTIKIRMDERGMSPDISQHIVDILRTITTDGLPVGKEQAYNLGQILQKNKVHFSVAIGGIYHFRKVSHPFLLREYESLEGYLAGLQHMEDIYHIMLLAISEGYQESQT